MNRFVFLIFLFLIGWSRATAFNGDVTITDFGAHTDLVNNAEAIQKAIDQCAANGGGIVRIPPGTYYTGTVILKDGVTLWLHPNAVLKGIPDLAVYYRRGLILGVNARNISITGGGTLDGNGGHSDLQFGNNSGRSNADILSGFQISIP